MEKNLLNNYVLNCLKSIEQHLSAYTKDKNPESLHRLRIEIKKIKALFYFADFFSKEKYDAPKLKSLFFKAGKIREIQINIQLLSAVPSPPEALITQLKEKEDLLTQQFIKNVPRSILLINKIRKKNLLPKTLPAKKAIIKFFKKERRKANKISKRNERESMHLYRKKIKKMMYVYNALPKKVQHKIELNEAEINIQQQKLGDWHDTYSAIIFFSKKHFPMQTSEYMLKLEEKEKRQFNTLLVDLANNPR